ncbi:hypothetical protein U0C82_00445 [Fulvimarina sp. 2208YS6-2-32]|uniref:Chemotaxis protein n=1 Tax=Fulvimarina uroteuthidis TaxID=3098149 RepID=A0ABU5I0C0_9HYPH|nr:hypothetical protein [Fulvimarina sp. 2208YS6-2-32]MDY8107616.1 hypothetical protein [Fulvimarina sp. 2208YS6-2-32]
MASYHFDSVPADADLLEQPAPAADLDAIARVMTLLDQWNTSSESVYLKTGEELQAIHADLCTIEATLSRTIDIMTGERIAAVHDELVRAVEEAAVLSGSIDRIDDLIRTAIAGRSEAIEGKLGVVSVFQMLRYVTLVGRTHIRSMPISTGELDTFVDNVVDLVNTGEETATMLGERLDQLGDCLSDSVGILETTRRRASDEARPLPIAIGEIDEALTARQESAKAAQEKKREAFRAAAAAVAGVVSGLQFHDIARQRLEHTSANIRLMIDLAKGVALPGRDHPPGPEARDAFIAKLADLEIAQLGDLAAAYDGKMRDIEDHLGRIFEQSQFCSGLVLNALEGDQDSQSTPLLGGARQIEQSFSQSETLRTALQSGLDAYIETAGFFSATTAQLDSLEFHLQIAGFNAAIRAAHIEQGDEAIGYIAREIRGQASGAKFGADRVRSGIEAALVAANELQDHVLPRSDAAVETIRAAIALMVTTFTEAEAECLAQLSANEDAATSLPDRVSRARSLMGRYVEGCELMDSAVAALTALCAALGDRGEIEVDYTPLAEAVSRQYTMREERQIFETIFAIAPARPTAVPTKAEGPSGEPASAASCENGDGDEDLSDVFF